MMTTEKLLEMIANLKTIEECEALTKNINNGSTKLDKDTLLVAIKKQKIKIKTNAYISANTTAINEVEIQCVDAVHAYEEVLSYKSGKNTKANRTWPMFRDKGIIPAVESIVINRGDAIGYELLVAMGLANISFEAVVSRNPSIFSAEAVRIAEERLNAI